MSLVADGLNRRMSVRKTPTLRASDRYVRRISRSVLRVAETVYLGTHAVPASVLLSRLDPAAVPVVDGGRFAVAK